MMGWKMNIFLSIGALFPFFILSMIISLIILKDIIFSIPTTVLFIISLSINLYAIKFMSEKEKFNPSPIKIESVENKNLVEQFITLLTLIVPFVPIFIASGYPKIDSVLIFLFINIFLIISYALYEKESTVSQVLSLRLLFPRFYIAKTDNKSTVYLFSKEKLQTDRNIKAYHVLDDVYIFGYRTN